MKKLLVVSIALLLAACIEIDDIGSYWNKTFIDPDLKGAWEKVSSADNNRTGGWLFTEKEGAYQVQLFVNGQLASNGGPIYPVRTLAVGPYHFLVAFDKSAQHKAIMERYEIKNNELKMYDLSSEQMGDFIKKNYPNEGDIQYNTPTINIKVLSNRVFKIFSEIPDNETFWHEDMEYRCRKISP